MSLNNHSIGGRALSARYFLDFIADFATRIPASGYGCSGGCHAHGVVPTPIRAVAVVIALPRLGFYTLILRVGIENCLGYRFRGFLRFSVLEWSAAAITRVCEAMAIPVGVAVAAGTVTPTGAAIGLRH